MQSRAAGWLDALTDSLQPGRVVTDPEILESHRRDEATMVDAGMPAALVRAASTADVQAVLRVAHEHRVAVVPRGAGSGLAGGANAVDGCIVLSLAGMDKILELDPHAMVAVVQPGVVNAELAKAAREVGLFYPPDPASYEFSTLGGNIATNAGGLCCVKYGVTRESVLGLEAVLADGSLLRTGTRTIKSVAGYDLTRLLVGSEGTLAVITEATLRLRPRPRTPATLVAFFSTLTDAGNAIAGIVERLTPSLLELMDRQTVRAVEAWKPMDLDTEAAAMLLARSDTGAAESEEEIRQMASLCEAAGATLVIQGTSESEGEMLLAARRLAHGALERLGATMLDDVAVSVSRIPDLLDAIQQIAAAHEVTVGTFGHAGDGNMHPTIIFDPDDPESEKRARRAFDAILTKSLELGGTLSGEHGVGLLKHRYLEAQVGETALRVQRAIKAALDPRGILNPGKVL
ncbi:MAG: FAD-binding oxidoreductase [Thermoanaerobaculia bacterium]